MTLLCTARVWNARTVVTMCALVLIFALHADVAVGQTNRSVNSLSTPEIARRVTPSVTTITTPTGNGSGVVVDASGVVVTNLHVVQGETDIAVTLANGDVYDDIAVVDLDERRDLVLLKIKAFNITPATLGNSDDVQVGEDVVLVGSPQGLDLTVSEGVISALRDSGKGYRMLQTTAPASPGSSGGGMFNVHGELIGIVTSQIRQGQNLNFAVPVNYVRGLISTDATMTLTELAERTNSGSGGDTNQTNAAAATDDVDPASVAMLSAIIDSLSDDLESGEISALFEFDHVDDTRWIVTYTGGSYLDDILLSITLFLDEFDQDIVWIRGVPPDPDGEWTTGLLTEILQLSYNINFAKVTLDDDASVYTMVETELRTLDSRALLRAIFAVADAADDVAGILLDRATEDLVDLSRTPQSGDTSVDLLEGNIVVRFSPSEWLEQPADNAHIDVQYQHRSGELIVAIDAERLEIPASNVPDVTLEGVRDADPNASILRRGVRTVNGISVTYWEHAATIDGIKFTYLGHSYSNSNGTIQIVGGTTTNLFEEHRSTIENFVAGLEVSAP